MTQTVRWLPATAPNIIAYRLLYSDTGVEGPFLTLGVDIPNMMSGANWDGAAFFVTDVEIPYRWYRLNTIDTSGTVFGDQAVAPFGPNNDPIHLPIPNTYAVTQDTGGAGALRYLTPDGVPILEATVRVYTLADWEARRYSRVVGLTKTDALGDWLSPIFVEPGNSFIVHFELPGTWGPDTTEITV